MDIILYYVKLIHGVIAFLFLAVLLISIIRAALKKIPNLKKDIFLTLTLIFAHIQLLIGLVLLIKYYYTLGSASVDFEIIMKNSEIRGRVIEHPLAMLISVILITYGKGKAKNFAADAFRKGNRTIIIYFTIALFLLALTTWDKFLIVFTTMFS